MGDAKQQRPRVSLTMALVRMLWPPDKPNVSHGFRDALIGMQLEEKLSHEKIFELYANQVYLGGSGIFIRGLGAATQYYFHKHISNINLPEAAQLAGMISQPDYYNPFRHPDRLMDRRNVVLELMSENGFISHRDYAIAVKSPLTVPKSDAEAPYFADMISDELNWVWLLWNDAPNGRI